MRPCKLQSFSAQQTIPFLPLAGCIMCLFCMERGNERSCLLQWNSSRFSGRHFGLGRLFTQSCSAVEEVGPATTDYLVGVRKAALLPTETTFQIMLNRQEICEKEETLARIIVNSLPDAASACRSMPGCSRFVYYTISATPTFEANTVFLCSGLSRGVSAESWIAGVMPEAVVPQQQAKDASHIFREPGPLLL